MMRAFILGALVLAAAPVAAEDKFPAQPTTGNTETIEYANQVPSVATFPRAGAEAYEFSHAGSVTCVDRTYVLQTQTLLSNPDRDTAYLQSVMGRGGCGQSSRGDKHFRVIRFESFKTLSGQSDLAYAETYFSAEEAGGTPLTIRFYVSRKDIRLAAH